MSRQAHRLPLHLHIATMRSKCACLSATHAINTECFVEQEALSAFTCEY